MTKNKSVMIGKDKKSLDQQKERKKSPNKKRSDLESIIRSNKLLMETVLRMETKMAQLTDEITTLRSEMGTSINAIVEKTDVNSKAILKIDKVLEKQGVIKNKLDNLSNKTADPPKVEKQYQYRIILTSENKKDELIRTFNELGSIINLETLSSGTTYKCSITTFLDGETVQKTLKSLQIKPTNWNKKAPIVNKDELKIKKRIVIKGVIPNINELKTSITERLNTTTQAKRGKGNKRSKAKSQSKNVKVEKIQHFCKNTDNNPPETTLILTFTKNSDPAQVYQLGLEEICPELKDGLKVSWWKRK